MRFIPALLTIGCVFPSDDTTDDTDTTVDDTDTTDTPDDCVDPHLEWWCFHSEGDLGPVIPDTGNAACDPPSMDGATSCGAYEVVTETGGFSGVDHYFLNGDHVATKYWTDVNSYCGGFVFWYGAPVTCP